MKASAAEDGLLQQTRREIRDEHAAFTPGKIYGDYDSIIRLVQGWIETQIPRVPGCSVQEVRARLVQRVVEITNEEYARQALSNANASSGKAIEANGIRICTKTGKVSISFKQWSWNLVQFVAVWVFLLVGLLRNLFRTTPQDLEAATLLMEGPSELDDRFESFCTRGPIEPLNAAKHLIVATRKSTGRTINRRISCSSSPLTFLVGSLQGMSKIAILGKHFVAPFYCLWALVSCRVSALLGRDLSAISLVRALDERGAIDSIVLTTSAFMSQPLWMRGWKRRNFKLHMIWYSQNFIPKRYPGDRARPDLPAARHMRVDVHWVWTEGFASYLRELGQTSRIRAVGPILWYLPGVVRGLDDDRIKIALFDVTPLPDGKTAFGAVKNYYAVETITTFVKDALEICDELATICGKEVLVVLKHKRVPQSGRHDATYLDFLEATARARTTFRLIEHDTNLYGLLTACDLSISVPYTSTAYVADSVARPAIYYDPFGELTPDFERTEHVYFAAGRHELRQLVGRCLNVNLG